MKRYFKFIDGTDSMFYRCDSDCTNIQYYDDDFLDWVLSIYNYNTQADIPKKFLEDMTHELSEGEFMLEMI